MELALDHLPEMLKTAGNARSQSIKLSGVNFAGDLAKQLLTFAEELEGLFKELRDAVGDKDEPKVIQVLSEIKSKEEAGEKAKASGVGTPMGH
eukprot:Skav203276  [mRNA]  locus=scaffold324:104017:104295:+ [translate_table: standard]